MQPLQFTPSDSYEMAGRGRVWTGIAERPSLEERGNDWLGRSVTIEGRPAIIKGVETFCLPRPIRAGDRIGLLVEFAS